VTLQKRLHLVRCCDLLQFLKASRTTALIVPKLRDHVDVVQPLSESMQVLKRISPYLDSASVGTSPYVFSTYMSFQVKLCPGIIPPASFNGSFEFGIWVQAGIEQLFPAVAFPC